ncbi:GNAT family N-acetyltransferase [Dyella acidiphila]|uniref:GNAT family N-acetyltransferase n=1 Tax=Dyella acidiphila TaxID=2775866 RepID=A0ABR9GCB0_9GAMM|nr:GNAT family N-acetyltransferase [Dyella acidiphila]MBE1161698.1 GNAT family N-acetyltransferase [Dyella acidiphila]
MSTTSARVLGSLSRHAQPPPPANERFARSPVLTQPKGEAMHTADGRELVLRNIEPGDVAAVQRCFKRLPAQDVRRRFMHAMSELPAPMAQRLCRIDPELEAAYVLMDETVTPAELRGVGRIFIDVAANSAEFSVLVEREWSRIGLGALLMQRLVDECRRRGLGELWGYVLMENRPMLELCKELGFVATMLPGEAGTAQIRLAL